MADVSGYHDHSLSLVCVCVCVCGGGGDGGEVCTCAQGFKLTLT